MMKTQFVWLVAFVGGLTCGLSIGITGGVTLRLHPDRVLNNTQKISCKYHDQVLQLSTTSSTFILALFATIFFYCGLYRRSRRIPPMVIAGLSVLTGSVLSAVNQDDWMLIFGRGFIGVGFAFASQAIPLYFTEITTTRLHRSYMVFQSFVAVGLLAAYLLNFCILRSGEVVSMGAVRIESWRVPLGVVGIPAALFTFGAVWLPQTPDVQQPNNPFRNLIAKRNSAQLIIAVVFQLFQQLAGISLVILFGPVLFNAIGYGKYAFLFTMIIGAVHVISSLAAIYLVDRFGRRPLLLIGGLVMSSSLVCIAISYSPTGWNGWIVIWICTFVAAYATSWGPLLSFLIPNEIFPLETRSAWQTVTVCTNLAFTPITAHFILFIICWSSNFPAFGFGVLAFPIFLLIIFVTKFVPETKDIPIEQMAQRIWAQNKLWMYFQPQPQAQAQ